MQATSGDSKWRVFGAIGLGVLVTTIDASIVNIALPAIGRAFEVPLSTVSWVNLAYLMAVTATLLTLGRLSDLFGRRSIYLAGFGLFSAMAFLCGLAPSLPMLVCFRSLQAIGAAMMLSNALAILSLRFPSEERGRVFGLTAAFASAGVGIGPLLGGTLVSALSWRWVFWIYSPIAVVGTLLAWRVLPRENEPPPADELDLQGAILTLLGMICLVLSLRFLPAVSWVLGGGLGALAIMAGIGLFLHERKAKSPLVSPAFFTNPVLRAAILNAFLGYLALYIYVLLLPFFLIDHLGVSPSYAGLVLTAEPALSIFTGPIGGRLSDRYGSRVLVLIGLGITATGLLTLAGMNVNSSLLDATWRVGLIGLGFGLFYTPNKSALIGAAPPRRLGVATGMAEVASNLGMAAGIALGSALLAGTAGEGPVSSPTFAAGFSLAVKVASAICFVSILVCARWMNPTRNSKTSPSGFADLTHPQ